MQNIVNLFVLPIELFFIMKIKIIIPVYKETPNSFELISFIQGLKILKKYIFSLIIPLGLNVSFFEFHLKRLNVTYSIEQFDPAYFRNIYGYNRLMLSLEFYNRFIENDYLLIYQLDCYVFKDELDKWCSLGYDYIGAPWLYIKKEMHYFVGVGNGGLSLRNPKKMKHFLESDNIKLNFKGYWKLYSNYTLLKKIIRIPKILFYASGFKNNKVYFLEKVTFNEDYIFGFISQYTGNKIKIPSEQTALKFSFDEFPNKLFEINNNHLPFGCHGWFKSNEKIDFWKKHIKDEDII